MKVKRGQKMCPECGGINGARQHLCKYCEFKFPINKHTNANLIENWKELKRGDTIKVLKGSGPYYYDSSGVRTYLADAGPYLVQDMDDKGLMCFGIGKRNYGFAYLYMGKEQKSPIFSQIQREPHRIIKVRAERRDNISYLVSKRKRKRKKS